MTKTNFKKFMGTERPFEPKPLPPLKEPHPVPKGYKRVKDGPFNKLVKESLRSPYKPSAYAKHTIECLKRGIYDKDDVVKALLTSLKDGGQFEMIHLSQDIEWLRDAGYDWPELKAIEKSIGRKINEGSVPDETITITLGVKGDAKKKLAELLHSISNLCAMGCSRTWGVINGDRGEGARVDFDGDGADQLIDVKINGQRVKDLI